MWLRTCFTVKHCFTCCKLQSAVQQQCFYEIVAKANFLQKVVTKLHSFFKKPAAAIAFKKTPLLSTIFHRYALVLSEVDCEAPFDTDTTDSGSFSQKHYSYLKQLAEQKQADANFGRDGMSNALGLKKGPRLPFAKSECVELIGLTDFISSQILSNIKSAKQCTWTTFLHQFQNSDRLPKALRADLRFAHLKEKREPRQEKCNTEKNDEPYSITFTQNKVGKKK